MRAQQSTQNEPCPPPKPILVCVHSFYVRLQTIIQSLIVAAHRVLEVLLGDGLAGAERVVEHLLEAPSARA